MGATTEIKLVFTNELGDQVAGFTVRSATETILCETVEQLHQVGATAWADSVELLIWLSRTPEFWGDAAISATFMVWDSHAQQVRSVTVPRKGCEAPFYRCELA